MSNNAVASSSTPSASRMGPDRDQDDDAALAALDLESLDAESLFAALTAVERAIPSLLLCVKPILSHLSSAHPSSSPSASDPLSSSAGNDSETDVKGYIERYMTLLDKIQFVLRQTVYYLRETRVSPSTLRPPDANSIPTPFASTLPRPDKTTTASSGSRPSAPTAGGSNSTRTIGTTGPIPIDVEEGVQLGLYGSRMEARTLKEMAEVLRRIKASGLVGNVPDVDGDGAGDLSMEIDGVDGNAAFS